MTRTREQIVSELDPAFARDRELKLGTPEYKDNRRKIAALVAELHAATPLSPAPFTTANYDRWPDSWEQAAINSKRAEALLESQHQSKAARRADLDRLYQETQRKGAA